jgi:hypothetical protein
VGEIDSFGTDTTVTVAVPDWLGADTEVARMVIVGDEGTFDGAVYSPLVEILPHVAPLHPVPDTVQVTAVLVLPATVAENCCWPPVVT